MALFNRPIRLLLLALLSSLLIYIIYTNFFGSHNAQSSRNFYRPLPDLQNHGSEWSWTETDPSNMHHPNPDFKAAIVTFVRNDQLAKLRPTIRQVEDMFNNRHHYPYIILSDEDLTIEFKQKVASLTKSTILFPGIPAELWGYADHTNRTRAAQAYEDMKDIIFGSSEDYRFQARFLAGPVFQHPALQEYDYYWRIEAGSEYVCPLEFDPFVFMRQNNKKLSFSIALYEYPETIPTVWDQVEKFMDKHKNLVIGGKSKGGALDFVRNEDGKYNRCHFWTNFQIASLDFFRSPGFQTFFEHMDRSNGIFYERWGDPIIHTLAAALLLRKDEIHHWEDIGYRVSPFLHCPNDLNGRKGAEPGNGGQGWRKCACKPYDNFDWNGYSCLRNWQNA